MLLTSLARPRLGYRAWRAVHWLAYLAWPVAFAHSLTAGNDLRIWWVALIDWGAPPRSPPPCWPGCCDPGAAPAGRPGGPRPAAVAGPEGAPL